MSIFASLADREYVASCVRAGKSHRWIANQYSFIFPHHRGISERSVRRFCREEGITRVTDGEVDAIVGEFILNYGHSYGRRLMLGSVRSRLGVTSRSVSERRVRRSMHRLAPVEVDQRRRDVIDRTNPVPYFAPYFGYKVHMDQNEKIGQSFGCTHVAMRDGHSRMIVGYLSMEIKNPIVIYEFLFRPTLLRFGLFDQLRVDHGNEFVLCNFVQGLLSPYRYDQNREPYRQTPSTQNTVIERFWPELNRCVNYPIKRALIHITTVGDYDMSHPVVKFAYSFLSAYMVQDAAMHLIDSYNYHTIPGPSGGVPIEKMRATRSTVLLEEYLIPTTEEAVMMYEARGGRLSRSSEFGVDPLDPRKYDQRNNLFRSHQPDGRQLFSDIVHGRYDRLQDAFDYFYNLTVTL